MPLTPADLRLLRHHERGPLAAGERLRLRIRVDQAARLIAGGLLAIDETTGDTELTADGRQALDQEPAP